MLSKKWAIFALIVFVGSIVLTACTSEKIVEVTKIVTEEKTVVETVVETVTETVTETVIVEGEEKIVEVDATTFDSEVLQSSVPVLVDFWPPGAAPAACRARSWRSGPRPRARPSRWPS